MDKLQQILRLLDPIAKLTTLNKIDQIDSVKIIQQKTQIKPSQLAVILLITVLLFFASFFTRVTQVFVWFFCYFFPAYFTLIAMRDSNKSVFGKYLIYWLVYAFIWQVEPFVKLFIDRTFFNIVKLLITVLFLHNSFDFGNRFFESVLKPLVQKNAVTGKIDELIKKGQETIEQIEHKVKGQ